MVDTAKIKLLCVKLGFDDLSDDEMERVIARLSKPQPMQVCRAAPPVMPGSVTVTD